MNKVALTGIGVINAMGSTSQAYWKAVSGAECALSRKASLGPSGTLLSGAVGSFDAELYLQRIAKSYSGHARSLQNAFALYAAEEALSQAQIADLQHYGVVTEFSSIPEGKSALGLLASSQAAMLATEFGIQQSVDAYMSSFGSLNSLAHAYYSILMGRAKGMLVVGSSESSNILHSKAFSDLGLLNEYDNGTPQVAVRPYDLNAIGTVLGEGATALVLEDLQIAKNRGATIYGVLRGIGRANDAKYIVKCEENGSALSRAVGIALDAANVSERQIDFIVGSGCGVLERDVAELKGLQAACKNIKYGITTSLPGRGHMLGCEGITQAATAALALHNVRCTQGEIYPTRNCQKPIVIDGKRCPFVVMSEVIKKRIENVLVTSVGLSGANAALVISRI